MMAWAWLSVSRNSLVLSGSGRCFDRVERASWRTVTSFGSISDGLWIVGRRTLGRGRMDFRSGLRGFWHGGLRALGRGWVDLGPYYTAAHEDLGFAG